MHVSVLFEETLDLMNLKPGMSVVDGTLGGGGHAQGILQRIAPNGMLIGIDKDVDAIARCKERLRDQNVRLVHRDFKAVTEVLEEVGIAAIDAAVLDLGVSSFQLDEAERGFSYMQDAPLDMRMNRTDDLSAVDVVNGYSQEELTRVIREYGEEKWAARIAQFIVNTRSKAKIETTLELETIIKQAIPAAARREGPHPAKRTFQALRIEVNGELRDLGKAMEDYTASLKPGGRLAVITFHSLEDRIVKQAFKKLQQPCECPSSFPICVCGKKPSAKIVTRKPVTPSAQELEENPRARSAKLRVLEKINEG